MKKKFNEPIKLCKNIDEHEIRMLSEKTKWWRMHIKYK